MNAFARLGVKGNMARSRFLGGLVLLLLLHLCDYSHGLNNKRQKPKNKVCTDLGSIHNCKSYAKCMYKGHCRSNSDDSWNRFKLLIMLPLSQRTEEEFIIDDYGDEESQVYGVESVRTMNSATERYYRMLAASVAAVHHINERDGSIVKDVANLECNFKFNYSFIDTQSDPSSAIDSFTAGLLQQGTLGEYDYLLGAGEDQINTPLSILSRVHNLPMISSSSFDPEFDDKTVHPYFSRASPSHGAIVEAVVAYLSHMNFGQAALLYVEGPGTLLKDNLIYEGLHEGVTLEPFPLSGDVDDRLNQTLDSIVEATFNIIIATVPFELIEPVLSRSSDRDLVREGRLWLFTDTYDENQLNSMAEISPNFATLMNGTLRVVTDTGTSSGEGFNRFLNHWPSFEKFRAEIEDILPDGANAPPFVESDSLTFDLPEKLFQEPDMLTPKEAFAYDSTVAAAFALCAADQARVDLRKANDKRAGILAELTKQVEFEGASGHFRLLRRTGSRDPSTLSFALENHIFIPDDKGGYSVNNVVVGAWTTQNSTWQLQEEKIRYYPGNVRVRPLVTDVIPIEDNRVFTEAQIFIFFFAAVIYLMVFGFFSWVMVNYEKPVVRASQPFFLNLVLLGVFVSNTSVFFLSDHFFFDSGGRFIYSCQLAFWFWSVGTTIATSALLVKTYRIFKLFINPKLLQIKNFFKDLLAAIAVFVSIDVAILAIWTYFNPWVVTQVQVGPFDTFGRPSETYAVCRGALGYRTELPYVIVLFLFHFSMYMIGGFLAWKSRHVSTDFQEGKWIGLSLASQLQVLAFALPSVAATQGSNTTVPFIVLSVAVITVNLVLLLVLFLPKIFRLRYGLQEVKLDNKVMSSDNDNALRSFRSYQSGTHSASPPWRRYNKVEEKEQPGGLPTHGDSFGIADAKIREEGKDENDSNNEQGEQYEENRGGKTVTKSTSIVIT